MMQKLTMLLMATMMVCLSMGVVSCKDDDDENKEKEVGGATEMSADANDDAAVLASLLQVLCEYEGETVSPDILNQSFEPAIGTVDDESQPTVRTIVAGTLAEADNIAVKMLGSLGIGAHPNGFQYSNNAIGTVNYQHGTGSELATITFSVKQIPHLTKIVFTATAKDNADFDSFYKVGDVVLYKDKYYICVGSYGEIKPTQNWLHINTPEEQKKLSTSSCKWLMTGKDIYYDGKMADRLVLGDWLRNVVFSDDYDSILEDLANLTDDEKRQVLPCNDADRLSLLNAFTKPAELVVWEAWKTVKGEVGNPRVMRDYSQLELGEKSDSWQIMTYKPKGLLLSNLMRWSGVFGTHDYWVPYVCLLKDGEDAVSLADKIDDTPSMTTLSPSHFKWGQDGCITVKTANNTFERYWIYDLAIHWTHEAFTIGENNTFTYYGLLDFTRENTDGGYWDSRNITSSCLQFSDTGKPRKGMTLINTLLD